MGGEKNFKLYEMACNDKNRTPVPEKLKPQALRHLHNLQVIRDFISNKYGKQISIRISSGYRTANYNDVVLPSRGYKTAKGSYHKRAVATDLKQSVITTKQLAADIKFLIDIGVIDKGGLGLYNTFVHYDSRGYFVKWDNSTKYNFKFVIFDKIKNLLTWRT